MLCGRTDLPLHRDAVGRFLPWLIAFMVLLAALAVGGAVAAQMFAQRWSDGGRAQFTVQIPPVERVQDENWRVAGAVQALRALQGVVRVEPMSDAEVTALLTPWLGVIAQAGDLPLPRLIDVEVDRTAELDAAWLGRALASVAPDAVIDDHGVWLLRITALARSIMALALGVMALIVVVTVGTVIFATRTGLAVHREAVEVLHLIGAQDGYIAKQFASRALRLGLRGGLIGLCLAVPLLVGIGLLVRRVEPALTAGPSLGVAPWLAIASLPIMAAAVAMLTARFTVLGALRRMV